MRTVSDFLKFIFSAKYRQQKRQEELKFVQYQIKTILNENRTMHKIMADTPAASLGNDLRSNYQLLDYYNEKEDELKKKLGLDL